MTKEFIETLVFMKRWSELNLSEDDLKQLQNHIMQNPNAGDAIEGTGGTRKLRYALPNRGKSGGIRVIFIDLLKAEHVYLITCYSKTKKDSLTDIEKAAIKEMIKRIIKNERQ